MNATTNKLEFDDLVEQHGLEALCQHFPWASPMDLSKVDTIELKADGSLMSTYTHGDDHDIRLKSKGSLFSEQATDAMKWLALPENEKFRNYLGVMDRAGVTVNLEWCAPFNRIVIGYAQPHLKVLNARYRTTGDYMDRSTLVSHFGEHMIDAVDTAGLDTAAFVQSIPKMQDDIEGYVAHIGDLWFKIKTEKYMSLHHAKDSINNPRRLFEAVLDEGVDDLRSMFAHDQVSINLIDEMQTKVSYMYNHLVATVDQFYADHKHEDRKTYAIAAQGMQLQGISLLGLLMNKYIGRSVDIKDFLKGKYMELGFKDVSIVAE